MSATNRRRYLAYLAGLTTGSGFSLTHAAQAARLPAIGIPALLVARGGAALREDPFTLGVASGYPHSTGVVLWTRLAPEPFAPDGGLAPVPIALIVELATDEAFKDVVVRQQVWAEPQWGHSVHAELQHLAPDRWYWYRFTVAGFRSGVGKTKTAPSHDKGDRVRIAVASCQHMEQGYFAAYRQMVADEPDLIVHLGDYIYEGTTGPHAVRRIPESTPITLSDYRIRHARYKSDTDLQRAHAACPWMLTWDDHEVDNDYAGDLSAQGRDPVWFLARRAAAYQAYYEHMPLPRTMLPVGAGMRIYTELRYGRLARFLMLDGRQYRTPMACSGRGTGGAQGTDPRNCADLHDPKRSFLGARQCDWLLRRLPADSPPWNLINQPTVFAPTVLSRKERQWMHTDSWDGYPTERNKILAAMGDTSVRNPVVFSGDVHVFYANSLHEKDEPGSRAVGSEFVCSAITSPVPSKRYVNMVEAQRESVRYANPDWRGYLRADITAKRMMVDMMAVRDVRKVDSATFRLAGFVVEEGQPIPVQTS